MKEKILYILNWFKEKKVSVLKLEKDLGFSNGLLGKAAKGTTTLSEDKWCKLDAYYKTKLGEGLDGALSVQTAVNTLLGTGAIQPAFDVDKINQRIIALEWVGKVEEWCEKKGFPPSELIEKYENMCLKCGEQALEMRKFLLQVKNKPLPAPPTEKLAESTLNQNKSKEGAGNSGESDPGVMHWIKKAESEGKEVGVQPAGPLDDHMPEGLTPIQQAVWKNNHKMKNKSVPITEFGVTKKVKSDR